MNARVALVTGASRGIGRAVAGSLLSAGYRVAAGYRRHEEEALELAAGNDAAIAVHIDVTDAASIDAAMAQVESRFGGVDILVNNAGYAQVKSFAELSDEDWQNMLSVHLLGAVRCVRRVLPGMLERRHGRIVNIVSVGGQWGGVHQVHYAAAKAGLINFTQSLAKLYAASGITANAISPGLIDTEMIREELSRRPPAADPAAGIPVGRLGRPEEVAAAAVYLCSDAAAFVTGHTLNVNGGVYFG
jgi:NAD(P)-dependent dehydrogenase (short-subunit alcohol dehydrogenase family)